MIEKKRITLFSLACTACIVGALVALFCPLTQAREDPCYKAKVLFNQSLQAKDLALEQKLLERAKNLCKDPEVLGPVLNNLGDTYERQGKPSKAFFYYKKAVAVKPDLAITYFGAAHLYLSLGDPYSAYLVYKKGLGYDPNNQKAREAMAKALEMARTRTVVYFEFASARLSPEAKRRLRLFAQNLKGSLPLVIKIEGHTCDLGPAAYNERLAMRRARAVEAYLKKVLEGKKVNFKTCSFGERVPLIKAKDPIARKLNRRVEIIKRRTQRSRFLEFGKRTKRQ